MNQLFEIPVPSVPSVTAPCLKTCGVLLVGNFLSETGLNRTVCEELAIRLEQRGWPLITTSRHLNKALRLVDMVTTTWRRRRDYSVAQVDVYSGQAFLWAEAACFALRRAGKPYILTLHGGGLPAFAERHPQRVRRLLGSARRVTSPSTHLQQAMAPYVSGHEIRVLPNAIDLNRYVYRERTSPSANLVWLRAFSEIYNPTLGPRIVAELAAEFPDIRLTMIGPDKGDGSFQATTRLAAELGVADRMIFPGGAPKEDVPARLAEGDIFLNTTNFDNTPVSVIEAMACGLPIVTTNVGGIPHLATHEYNALLTPPSNPKAMSDAIRRLLKERGLSAKLSAAARRTAEAFDWGRVLPEWEALFMEVAAIPSGGSRWR